MASHHKPSGLPPTPARLPPSARSAVPSRLQPQHSSSGSNPWLPSPSLSTRAAFSSGLSKGLATLAGTASSAAGQVSTLLGTRETEAERNARTPVDGSDSTKIASSSDGSKLGVRATVGGWIGRGNKKRSSIVTKDRLLLFPGWAVRKQTDDDGFDDAYETAALQVEPGTDPHVINPFEIHLHISGFCTTLRPPEAASTFQRMFSRLAVSVASLPDVPQPRSSASSMSTSARRATSSQTSTSPSLRSGSSLTSSPEPILAKDTALTDEPSSIDNPSTPRIAADAAIPPLSLNDSVATPTPRAESGFSPLDTASLSPRRPGGVPNHRSAVRSDSLPPALDRTSSNGHIPQVSQTRGCSELPSAAAMLNSTAALDQVGADILALHENLNRRLQPFFAAVIPNRQVLIEVRPRVISTDSSLEPKPRTEAELELPPLLSMTLTTNLNGAFTETVRIPWDVIVESPECLEMIFPEKRRNKQSNISSNPKEEWALEVTAKLLAPSGQVMLDAMAGGESSKKLPPLTSTTVTPLSQPRGIRVISDLDDTVKRTDLMAGLREVFRNVFARDVRDLEVAGMGALYRSLVGNGEGGVKGWHYVSNSPYELYDPIHSFLTTHAFPPGFSLRLKFYGGKSMFKGIWEPAGEKKMAGVLEIITSFPESKFILFGDSAEQDLDLYASIAHERPHQILGIFIRDVTSGPSRSSTGNTFASSSSTSSASSIRSDRSTPPASPSLAAITTGSVVGSSSGPGRVHRIASAIRPGFTRSSTTASTPSRSRSNSLLAAAQALNPTNEPTWDALSPNNPPFDLAIANTSLERQQQANNESTPPTVSESDLDPIDNAPPSPKFDAAAVTVPDEVIAEEAVSSARAKQLKRAEEFAGRFMKARSELRVKGVVVEKFREASEIEEVLHGLVFGKKGE